MKSIYLEIGYFRFHHLFEDFECVLVSATHPRYKLAPSVDWLPGVHAERLRYRTKEYLINIIKESEPEEFENNEAGHQIETKDLEDEFMSTLLKFPDKKSGVNQTEQFLRESSPLKHFDLSQRGPTTGPRPAEQFCTSLVNYKQWQPFFLENAMILDENRNFGDRFQLKTFFFFF